MSVAKRRDAIVRYISMYTTLKGTSPTQAQMSKHFGVHKYVINDDMTALKKDGRVTIRGQRYYINR